MKSQTQKCNRVEKANPDLKQFHPLAFCTVSLFIIKCSVVKSFQQFHGGREVGFIICREDGEISPHNMIVLAQDHSASPWSCWPKLSSAYSFSGAVSAPSHFKMYKDHYFKASHRYDSLVQGQGTNQQAL